MPQEHEETISEEAAGQDDEGARAPMDVALYEIPLESTGVSGLVAALSKFLSSSMVAMHRSLQPFDHERVLNRLNFVLTGPPHHVTDDIKEKIKTHLASNPTPLDTFDFCNSLVTNTCCGFSDQGKGQIDVAVRYERPAEIVAKDVEMEDARTFDFDAPDRVERLAKVIARRRTNAEVIMESLLHREQTQVDHYRRAIKNVVAKTLEQRPTFARWWNYRLDIIIQAIEKYENKEKLPQGLPFTKRVDREVRRLGELFKQAAV